jgi:hypothetical protein
VGLYSLVGLKVTPSAAIGFLTILGYSLYDTVVVFDKVRENVRSMANKSLDEYKRVVNLALNQTLIRSINTSVVAIIPIASILIIGGYVLEADTLKDISLALVIGQSIGTYSSIFIAAPALVALNRKGFRQKQSYITKDPFSIEKTAKIESASVKYDAKFADSTFAEFSEKNTPIFFSSFFNQAEAWDQLWIDSPVPGTLEECASLIKKKLLNKLNPSKYYFLGNLEQTKIFAIFKVSDDPVNSNFVFELIALNSDNEGLPEGAFEALREHAHKLGFYRVTFMLTQSAVIASRIVLSQMAKEGQLSQARLMRSGERVDLLIYSASSE